MRPLIYGNGSLLVCVDERGIVRDFYYPHAGMENHGGYVRLGLFDLDAQKFAWLEDWEKTPGYKKLSCAGAGDDGASMIGESVFADRDFGAAVTVEEMVHHEKDVFLRTFTVRNTADVPKSFRLFSAQNYHILENDYANTAVRDGPMMNHYKRDRFVIQSSLPVFDQFSAGIAGWRDKQGTWKDAEDGRLEGNVVAHGTVDSAIAWTLPELPPGGAAQVHFWACVGRSFRHARELHDWIRVQDIDQVYASGGRYWNSFCARARSRGALAGIGAGTGGGWARGAAGRPARGLCPQPAGGGRPRRPGRLDHRLLRLADQAAGGGLLHVLLAPGRGLGRHRAGQSGV